MPELFDPSPEIYQDGYNAGRRDAVFEIEQLRIMLKRVTEAAIETDYVNMDLMNEAAAMLGCTIDKNDKLTPRK